MTDVGTWVEQAESPMLVWPLLIIALVGLVLTIAIVNGPKLFRGTRSITDSLWCPVRGRYVSTDFEIDTWNGHRVEVARCNAFDPPTAVTCDKTCLDPRKLRARRRRAPAA